MQTIKKMVIVWFICLFSFNALLPAAEPIKIAAVYSLSGEAVAISYDHLMAARIALEEINAAGGILGRPVQLIEFDNQSTALGARNAAVDAVTRGVTAVIGGPWSSHAIGMGEVLQDARIPLVCPIATNPMVTQIGDYIFRTCFIDSYQGKMLARFAYNDLKAKKVAVLTNVDQVYAIGLSEEFIKRFKALGGQITAKLDYIENLTQYEDLMGALLQHDFDAVMLPGYSRDAAQIIKTARHMGVDKTFIGGDGWSSLMFNYAQEELSNCYYLTHWHKDLKDERSVAFTKKILETPVGNKITSGMALTYDTMYLLADAIRRAGSAGPEKIRDALARTRDFIGVTGPVVYDKKRNPIKQAVILKAENGKFVLFKQIVPER